MASELSFVEFVVDQFDADCAVTYKRMFGEYGLYSDGKFFAVICDDKLFVKPTDGGRAFIGEVVEIATVSRGQAEPPDWGPDRGFTMAE